MLGWTRSRVVNMFESKFLAVVIVRQRTMTIRSQDEFTAMEFAITAHTV